MDKSIVKNAEFHNETNNRRGAEMRDHSIIDLKSNTLEIRSYPVDMIREDLKVLGFRRPMDLDLFEYAAKVFQTDAAASSWREKYIRTRERLIKNAKAKPMPKLLMKRRYIVLAALGEKLVTKRTYRKPWAAGQLIQLYDQTIFLTVRLTKILDTGDGYYTYEYKLA